MPDNEQDVSSVDHQKPSVKKSEREARSAKALRENLKKRRQQVKDRQTSKDEK